ncbi:MAG TPA: nuclear transport factor 2 family protein [bacterium]|nr:nuclear transport factor 2 family protein [bacterium]
MREAKTRSALRRAGAAAVILMLIGLGAGGCDYLEKRRIERTLDDWARAAMAGDTQGFLALFAPDYEDPRAPLPAMKKRAVERLKESPRPVIGLGRREIEIKGGLAMVTQRFTMEDTIEGKPMRYDEAEHLLMERGPGGWACRRGSEILRLLSGRMEDEYEIEQTLLQREGALVKEDINTYMSLVSPRYRHKGETAEDIRKKVLQNFRVYDDIQFRSFDRKIWYFGDAATVQQKFTMHAVQMGTPMTFSGEERFELEKTPGGWKFTQGL